ncbi:MAG: nicotinate-nucleotide adenylyltransferase [SAR202 cluster bacterium]|nr:nicotinate-nucleotide adenylyltransferase [SAR202 cluster bacterium]MDP6513982.1 nicotinate-nucleotide adenylyltransferase [SAR202 cluster bacterium]MDP6713706.1 nicotinate-nucleotide adenylyltransferase [SAR202 cluster bacterium]
MTSQSDPDQSIQPSRIGLLGGTFDPIHMGHLLIAEDVREALDLDVVVFIPAGRPWLKADQTVTEPEHRMAMVELAVSSNPHFQVSDIEVRRPGLTYTVDTLQQLHQEYGPNTKKFLILGMDSLNELARWRSPERLFDLCVVVGVSRPGQEDIDLDNLESLAEGASDKVVLVSGPSVGISGTDIRDRVAHGESIKYRVPEFVESYILDHGLYTRQ